MFIHWGIYSIPARCEWVRNYESISNEDYQKYFNEFNIGMIGVPVKSSADPKVKAGMDAYKKISGEKFDREDSPSGLLVYVIDRSNKTIPLVVPHNYSSLIIEKIFKAHGLRFDEQRQHHFLITSACKKIFEILKYAF